MVIPERNSQGNLPRTLDYTIMKETPQYTENHVTVTDYDVDGNVQFHRDPHVERYKLVLDELQEKSQQHDQQEEQQQYYRIYYNQEQQQNESQEYQEEQWKDEIDQLFIDQTGASELDGLSVSSHDVYHNEKLIVEQRKQHKEVRFLEDEYHKNHINAVDRHQQAYFQSQSQQHHQQQQQQKSYKHQQQNKQQQQQQQQQQQYKQQQQQQQHKQQHQHILDDPRYVRYERVWKQIEIIGCNEKVETKFIAHIPDDIKFNLPFSNGIGFQIADEPFDTDV